MFWPIVKADEVSASCDITIQCLVRRAELEQMGSVSFILGDAYCIVVTSKR